MFDIVTIRTLTILAGFFATFGAQGQPGASPVANGTAAPAAAASSPSTNQRFDIFEFQIEGNTVLAAEQIERAVYPFLGEGRRIEDADNARAALEQVYRDRGYGTVSVDIPPQKVVGGVVVLNVVEGRVARLRVLGSRYFSQDRILAIVPALAEGSVPNLPEVQKQLVEVNSSADRRVTPLLRPGKEPGTTDVDLQVEDERPLHGSIELNDHNSPNTTSSRIVASLRYTNLFQRGHTLGIQAQVSPQNTSEVKVVAGTYTLPAADGTLAFSAVRSDSNTFVGGGIGVFGHGTIVGLRYVLPLNSDAPTTELTQALSLGIDYKNFQQSLSLSDGTGFGTPIHYAPLTLAYSGSSSDSSGTTEFNAGVTLAVRGLASHDQDFADKRYQALSNFSIFKFGLGRTFNLPHEMSTYVHVEGQLTGQPLVSNEQFVAGGVDSVRGYLESTQVGDSAVRGTVELRSMNLVPVDGRVNFVQLRAFFDAAYLRLRAPLPATRDAFELASTGIGVSLRAKPGINLRADLGIPLKTSGTQLSNRPRLQASAIYEF